jgi:MFS family permease
MFSCVSSLPTLSEEAIQVTDLSPAEYLATRGADVGDGSPSVTWRNYAIVNLCGIFGPILAGFMCEYKYLGRRGTMVVGAILAMIFFFAFTAVRTSSEILGFNCAINFCLNIYYGCLYAYTPEVLPSAHRATGNGISVACNRVMGISKLDRTIYLGL